jgi:hypothetical protein
MNKIWKQRLFAIFVGVMMILSVAGFATMRFLPEQKNIKISNVVNKVLDPEEKISILREGRTLIEFIYPDNCTWCPEKANIYNDFVNSDEFKDYAVLETAEVVGINDTIDRMISIYEIVDLSNVTTKDDLQKIFCSKATQKPEVCLLYEI